MFDAYNISAEFLSLLLGFIAAVFLQNYFNASLLHRGSKRGFDGLDWENPLNDMSADKGFSPINTFDFATALTRLTSLTVFFLITNVQTSAEERASTQSCDH